MRKRKYTVDLAGQQAECEANYARIMQLLPDMNTVDRREFGVDVVGVSPARFQITVKERCKYTTMLDISQLDYQLHSTTPAPYFSLRVYHDARMAEVVAYNSHHRLLPHYDYPNDKMYQRDEKAQLNTFLGEWLRHCLKYGHSLDDPAALTMKSE